MRAIPPLKNLLRFAMFANTEIEFLKLFPTTSYAEKSRKKYEEECLTNMKNTVPQKYHEIMTPNYGVGCKRRIFDKRWLQSLNDAKIELTTQPLRRVKENSVVIGPGAMYPANAKDKGFPEREIPADVIVLANGFDTTRWLHPLRVVGRDGKGLVEVMEERGGAQAYQGTAMDGFPNFFMIFGPNTATGHSSVVMASENMVQFSLKLIRLILNGEANTVEVKHEAEVAYTADLQKSLKNTVWMNGGCSSWYYTKDGWNSTVYPYVCLVDVLLLLVLTWFRYTQIDFWRRCTFPRWSDWDIAYTRKGMATKLQTKAVRLVAVSLAVVAAYRAHRRGIGAKDVRAMLQAVVFGVLSQLRPLVAALQSKMVSLRG